MDEPKTDAPVNDEAALDRELEETITGIKAGQVPEAAPAATVKPEVKTEETPTEPKEGEPSTPPAEASGDYEFRLPKRNDGTSPKGKFESDETYEKRIELTDLIQRRRLAKTEEQRNTLSQQIKETKTELGILSGRAKITNPLQEAAGKKEEEEDETVKADRERLKQLGGATKEDIQQIVQEERQVAEVKGTLEKFIERHAELKDDDTREVFFEFVDSNYNWQNKSSKELMTVLELARENMFRPAETLQERVLKGANVQEKVNAMQFPGGTVTKADYSPDVRKSIDELKATGMSEEKALELLAD